jgi:hypothetical protein
MAATALRVPRKKLFVLEGCKVLDPDRNRAHRNDVPHHDVLDGILSPLWSILMRVQSQRRRKE